MDYLAGLNAQPREAVLHKDGPIMNIEAPVAERNGVTHGLPPP